MHAFLLKTATFLWIAFYIAYPFLGSPGALESTQLNDVTRKQVWATERVSHCNLQLSLLPTLPHCTPVSCTVSKPESLLPAFCGASHIDNWYLWTLFFYSPWNKLTQTSLGCCSHISHDPSINSSVNILKEHSTDCYLSKFPFPSWSDSLRAFSECACRTNHYADLNN